MPVLTEADTGKTVDLTVGQSIEIRLPENATTGYRWSVKAIDTSVCEIVADERLAPGKIIPGAPGEHRWRLRATHAGACMLQLVYGRSWQSDASPARTFKVRLHVAVKD